MVKFCSKWIQVKFIFRVFSKKLYTHTYKHTVEIRAMCAQLDSEVRCKRSKKKDRPSNFINSGVKRFKVKNTPPKKTFDV
jgi:hypothetical protein